MSNEPAPRRRMRASDVDRDAVLNVLHEAHGAGRITIEELGDRQDAALHAKFLEDLPALVKDLPEGLALLGEAPGPVVPVAPPAGSVPANPHPRSSSATIMSGRDVMLTAGTIHYSNFAWWGGDDIDVTGAMGPAVVLTLELNCIMAGHNIWVPEGVRVLDESVAVMAGNDVDGRAKGDGSNGTLVLKGFLWWGGSFVKLRTDRRD